MEIKKLNLKWSSKLQTLYIAKVERIMLHHTAHPTWNALDVHNYHKNTNYWAGIGYNYFIEKDGTIEECRGFHVGAGAKGYNSTSLHICFAGNFETQKPTKEQIESGKWLVNYLLSLCSTSTKVVGHKDIGNTACPGKNFPLDEFKQIKVGRPDNKKERIKKLQRLLNYIYGSDLDVDGIIGPKTTEAMKKVLLKNYCANDLVRFVQERLIAYGFNIGSAGADGKFGKNTEKAVIKFQQAKNLKIDGIVGYNTIKALI